MPRELHPSTRRRLVKLADFAHELFLEAFNDSSLSNEQKTYELRILNAITGQAREPVWVLR